MTRHIGLCASHNPCRTGNPKDAVCTNRTTGKPVSAARENPTSFPRTRVYVYPMSSRLRQLASYTGSPLCPLLREQYRLACALPRACALRCAWGDALRCIPDSARFTSRRGKPRNLGRSRSSLTPAVHHSEGQCVVSITCLTCKCLGVAICPHAPYLIKSSASNLLFTTGRS